MKTYTNYYNTQIDEGLFSWLGKFFNWLFTDETSEDTKKFTKGAIKTASKTFSEDEVKQMQNLLKEKDTKKFEEQIANYRKEQFKDDETKGDEWEMILLSIKIRLSNDEKDKKTVEELTKRFHELIKKNPETGKKLASEIKKEEEPTKNSDKENDKKQNDDKTSDKEQENDNKLTELYDNHKEVIEEICNGKKIDLDKLTKSVSDYCEKNKIENAKQYYGLLLTKLGSMMSEKSDEYIKNICGE